MDFALENKINKRLTQLKANGIQFISGTVAPANSDPFFDEIESLSSAIAYFRDYDVKQVMLQPKYMGSRCQLYLNRNDSTLNKAVSRNGYLIKAPHILDDIFEDWKYIFDEIEKEDPSGKKIVKVILDGELMPWMALGNTLIKRDYFGLVTAVETQHEFLKNYGFEEAVASVNNDAKYVEFLSTPIDDTLNKKHLSAMFPRLETYLNHGLLEDTSISIEEKELDAFKHQLDLYAKDGVPTFKGFNILRIDYEDGTFLSNDGWLMNTPLIYQVLTTKCPYFEAGLVCSTDNMEAIQNYFNLLVSKNMEGVMIKPIDADPSVAPYIKVRNTEYLRLIYGYNYTAPYMLEKLIQNKNTGKKRKVSIIEYKLGMEMLGLDMNAVDYNENYDRIAKKLLFQIEEENKLDSRL